MLEWAQKTGGPLRVIRIIGVRLLVLTHYGKSNTGNVRAYTLDRLNAKPFFNYLFKFAQFSVEKYKTDALTEICTET